MADPKRGEVWLTDLGLAAKIRPVLVLSVSYSDIDYALFSIVPHTTSPRDSQFEIFLTVPGLKSGAFNIQGMMSVPKAKFLRQVASLSSEQMEMIENVVKAWLGLK